MAKVRFQAIAAAFVLVAACERPGGEEDRAGTVPPESSGGAPASPGSALPSPADGAAGMPGTGPVAGAERAFVADAAAGGLAEVDAGALVAQRAGTKEIKEYAERMEREHRSMNEELQRIAMARGIDLPAQPEGPPRDRLNRLNGVSGAELERTYLQEFGIGAHQDAIALYERQAREGLDAELRAFAERTLPMLREHLHLAQQLQGGDGAAQGEAAGGSGGAGR